MFPDLKVKKCDFPSVEELTSQLLSGNLWLVPYDCDRNHEPAFLNGHKAHWCIIVSHYGRFLDLFFRLVS